ncbi:unnamed protein product [Pleuronectes platessa]|uniref:Uncharacterized protein n=1 Tax=Pleuronectes platessa TaxID=8262 RepID=A0A9N7UF06_PLEPL|nr:unnamed protein product [Pleuronectes platessa]
MEKGGDDGMERGGQNGERRTGWREEDEMERGGWDGEKRIEWRAGGREDEGMERGGFFKEYNISRHFATKYANYASKQSTQERAATAQRDSSLSWVDLLRPPVGVQRSVGADTNRAGGRSKRK